MARFEKDFLIGSAVAAFQVEGNNMNSDTWVEEQLPHSEYEERSMDAVDHYHHCEEDIRMMAEAGLNAFRFSIEWARVQPAPDRWDEREIQHYKDVIACCERYQITPVVTMFHFTSPIWLIQKGGWENPDVVSYFAAYCKKMAEELGDHLTYVCTINEANMRMQIKEILKEISVKVGTEARRRDEEKDTLQIGLNLDKPDPNLAEKEKSKAFGLTWPEHANVFVSPCTDEGDLLVMKAHQAAKEAMLAVNPNLKIGITLTVHDVQVVPGGEKKAAEEWDMEFLHYLPYLKDDDFIGVQCYTRRRVDKNGTMPPEKGVPLTQMGYEEWPEAIGGAVRRVAKSYHGNILITENGIGTADDRVRIRFIDKATTSVKQCMEEGIPVKGYMYWSLLDNYEWQKGFSMTFGLIGVDRAAQTRHVKPSLAFLGSLHKR